VIAFAHSNSAIDEKVVSSMAFFRGKELIVAALLFVPFLLHGQETRSTIFGTQSRIRLVL